NTGGPSITASILQNVSCNGGSNGSGSVNVSGGTGPFTYAWSPLGGTGQTANNLSAGSYSVTVTDANGCISTDNITISEPASLVAQANSNPTQCNGSSDGSASANVAGGKGPYTYSWNPGGTTGANANNLAAGNYTVTITDSHGCTIAATTIVTHP